MSTLVIPPTLSLTEAQAIAAVVSFLEAVVPDATPVVRGQDNRVPEPANSDFIVVTPLLQERLTTNQNTYSDGLLRGGTGPTVKTMHQSIKATVQIDVHGPSSGDTAVMITTLFRDDWGVTQFQSSGFDVVPLYCEDPRQIPYLNGEQQVEERWSIDAVMQCNPVVTVTQDFAAALDITLIDVDVQYPPH